MSLIGIDMGSSSVKAAAFQEEGTLIGVTSHRLTGLHPIPGSWEQDPEEVWQATTYAMRSLMRMDALKKDPPKAIAISASGRENFPADAQGNPLGPGIMGADVRGAEFELIPEGTPMPETWYLSCGHMRERMDPVFRLLWWRKYRPDVISRAKYFLGWHDFLAMRICGRAATDPSSASRYAVYDLSSQGWSSERVYQYEIDPDLLPEVLPWGSILGLIKREVAEDWGLPLGVLLTLGGHDVNCAAVGAGVLDTGEACLISGSYENLLVTTNKPPTGEMLLRGLSVMPHPGEAGFIVLAVCPTGNAVLNWARGLVGMSIEEVELKLQSGVCQPSSVLAVPYLSGSMVYWEQGRKAKGALLGLTLATSPLDVVQALMESIAYDHVNTLSLLVEEGVNVDRIRATGGGTRSSWWTQLKADLTGCRIELVGQDEAGTLGAALLAGYALGIYTDLGATSKALSGTAEIHEPNAGRASLHAGRLDAYRGFMRNLLTSGVFDHWQV
jgi:sugar (pentulose or hexulose) kinase